MESNTNDTFGTQNTGSATTGSSFSATSTGSTGSDAGSTGSFSRDTAGETAENLADRARSAAGAAGEKLADVGSSVRDRAGNLKTTLADALQSGAEKLRQQGAGVAATAGSSGTVAETPQLGAAANQLAGGLQASADWLRDADLDGLKSGIERQVKEHPGRTLAVAVGLGYLLGKALRK